MGSSPSENPAGKSGAEAASGSIVATEMVPPLVTFVNSIVTGGASPGDSGGIGVTTAGPGATTTGAMTTSVRRFTPVLVLSAFDASSRISNVPAAAGTPDTSPVAVFTFSPTGEPKVLKLDGPLVPVIWYANGRPAVAVAVSALVIAGVRGSMTRMSVNWSPSSPWMNTVRSSGEGVTKFPASVGSPGIVTIISWVIGSHEYVPRSAPASSPFTPPWKKWVLVARTTTKTSSGFARLLTHPPTMEPGAPTMRWAATCGSTSSTFVATLPSIVIGSARPLSPDSPSPPFVSVRVVTRSSLPS